MNPRIHALPPLVANQIAAGEVIERPASVVKELLENSLDAKADTIMIEIGYGGLNQIKVSDNGCGIVAEDLLLAVSAHATSKITSLDDLYAIHSMGFRGEALASISSVARVTVSSKPASQKDAMMMQVKEGKPVITPCARTTGTTVDVVDIFFNAPVRKRFLKNEKLEFQAIEGVVKRFALSAPHINITLKHNNKVVLALPAALHESAQYQRMTKVLGSAFVKDALYLDVEHESMRLYGWISNALARSQNDKQWVYINQRMIKDKLISHAIKQTYEDRIDPGRFPACLLYFSIHASEVDVNVHPTKHEVRFQQPRLIHDFFASQISKALEHQCMKEPSEIPEISRTQSAVFELSEPLPKEFLYKSTPIESKKVPCMGSWIPINDRYAFITLDRICLVDIKALQERYVLEQLQKATFPLEHRPLLVPVTISIKENIQSVKKQLELLGIYSDYLPDTSALRIRTIPIQVPYLDLNEFLKSQDLQNDMEWNSLLHCISQAQRFEPRLLSSEEQQGLHQFLLEIQDQSKDYKGLFKMLSNEDCKVLLHA